jgi:hypothetical protein
MSLNEEHEQPLCTVHTALLNFMEHVGLVSDSVVEHLHKTAATAVQGGVKRSPVKRVMKRKRRSEDVLEGGGCGESGGKRAHLLHGHHHHLVHSENYNTANIVLPDTSNDPYQDGICLSPSEAESCLYSLASLNRLAVSSQMTKTVNDLLELWSAVKRVDYESLVYFIESVRALGLFDSFDGHLLHQVLWHYFSVELQRLKSGMELQQHKKSSVKLAIYLDIYRVVSRLPPPTATLATPPAKLLQCTCELILWCFESATQHKPAVWTVFAMRFCMLLATRLFPKKSTYLQEVCEACQSAAC